MNSESRPIASNAAGCSEADLPLVSCIMPTSDRRQFVGQSIKYFLRQDYPHKELVIVDDGVDRVADLIPDHPDIRYICLGRRHPLGAKRNLACEISKGAMIAHWDDDDWMSSERLSEQMRSLLATGASVCGLESLFFFELAAGRAWLYDSRSSHRSSLVGGTLLFRREVWQSHRFPEVTVGEDSGFIGKLNPEDLHVMKATDLYVGLIHQHNTAAKHLDGECWKNRPIVEVTRLLDADRSFYVSLRNMRAGQVPDTSCRWSRQITLAAPFMVYDGYGSMAEQLALGMQADGAEVNVSPLELNLEGTTDEFRKLHQAARTDHGDIVLYFCWPRPDLARFTAASNLVIYTMWEASRLPVQWPSLINQARAVIVPTRFVQKVCIDSGVTVPVIVVPQGVDTTLYPYIDRPTSDGITTLIVGTVIGRKHVREGIAAWKSAFEHDADARLIIKSRFGYNNYQPDDPRILFVDTNETTRGIAHWYARADVLLALGNEGFGLPLVEAMATGLPVIALNSEGQSDVCADARHCLLPVSPSHWEAYDEPPYGSAGERGVPSVEETAAHLRWVAEHRDAAKAMGRAASEWVRRNRNLDRMAPAVLDVLEQHIRPKRPLRKKDTLWVPSWESACGIAEYSASLADHMEKTAVTGAQPDYRGVRVLHIQHEPGIWNDADLLRAVIEAKAAGVSVAITEHAVDGIPRPWEGEADRLIVHTREGMDRLRARRPRQQLVRIPHGCPIWFPPRKRVRGQTIGVFGFLENHKGFWKILEILKEIPETQLLMFSHAKDPAKGALWDRDARGLPVRRVNGFIPTEEVARRLAAEADILVFWYDENPMASASGAVRTGLASGVPVLTSPVGWFSDVREATHQPEDLKNGVLHLLEDTALRNQLVDAAKAYCHEHSWRNTASRHRRLWRELQ